MPLQREIWAIFVTRMERSCFRVVADVRFPPKTNARSIAPVFDDRLAFTPEFGFVWSTSLDASKPDSRDLLDVGTGSYVKQGPVDPVKLFADFLDQQVDALEIGFERRSKKVGQNRQVECHRRLNDPGFKTPFGHA